MPLASLLLAGHSIAARQLELVLGLGCERIVCLSNGLGRDVIALQHQAEAAGARFNLIAGSRQLAGLVNTADELVVVAGGLLPAATEAKSALANGPGVLALPVEAGITAGFERIDLNHAWAGVLAMPGTLVERLNQLPPDCDAISALLRIALQGRVPERALPEAVLAERRWALVTSAAQLAELEPEWYRRHVAPPSPFAPGRAVARIAIRAGGAKLLARGWKPLFLAAGGTLIAGFGVVAAWFEQGVAGIALCGLGWLLLEAGDALASLGFAGRDGKQDRHRVLPLAALAIDLALIAVLALALPGTRAERLFAPLMLVGIARVAGALLRGKWSQLVQDRSTLVLLLAIAASGAALLPAIQLLSLALVAALLGFSRGFTQITQA